MLLHLRRWEKFNFWFKNEKIKISGYYLVRNTIRNVLENLVGLILITKLYIVIVELDL